VSRSSLSIEKGHSSRRKVVMVEGPNEKEAEAVCVSTTGLHILALRSSYKVFMQAHARSVKNLDIQLHP